MISGYFPSIREAGLVIFSAYCCLSLSSCDRSLALPDVVVASPAANHSSTPTDATSKIPNPSPSAAPVGHDSGQAISESAQKDFFQIGTVRQDKAKEDTSYDCLFTMFAINSFTVSLSTVIATEDRIVLEQEYDNVLNNLRIGNIEADKEIRGLCAKHLDTITNKTLREEERQRFLAAFERRKKQALLQAIGGVRAYGGDPYSFLLSLVQNAVSAYFSYASLKDDMREELDSKLWELRKDEVSDLNDVRKEFMDDAWTLLRKYKMHDDWRLTETTIGEYRDAINDQDKSRALRRLGSLTDQFQAYPPFWFYYGLTAQQNKDMTLAVKCYNTFEAIHRDILRKDPHYARVCLNKALLLGTTAPQDTVYHLLDVAAKQSDTTDGMSFLTIAMLYAQRGDKDKARHYLQSNIDNRAEISFSRIALDNLDAGRQIHYGVAPLLALQAESSSGKNTLEDVDIGQIRELAEKGLPEAEFALARRLASVTGANDQEVLQWLQKAGEQGYIDAQNMLGRKYLDARDYDQAYSWFDKSAKQNDATGYWGLAVCCRDGGGKYADEKNAAEYFKKAADCGDPGAMYEFGMCSLAAKGVPKNPEDALNWLAAASQKGNVKAQLELGLRLIDKTFIELQGDAEANGNRAKEIAVLNEKGKDKRTAEEETRLKQLQEETITERTEAQKKQGLTWLRKAAESGDDASVIAYWNAVNAGGGSSTPTAEQEYASKLATQLADRGNDSVQYFLGQWYSAHNDSQQALAWFGRVIEGNGTSARKALVSQVALSEGWKADEDILVCPNPAEHASVIDNAIETYAKSADRDSILFLWTDAWRNKNKGRTGFCFTPSHAFSVHLNDPNGVTLKDIAKVDARKTYSWLSAKLRATYWIYLDDHQFCECPKGMNPAKVVVLLQELIRIAKETAK